MAVQSFNAQTDVVPGLKATPQFLRFLQSLQSAADDGADSTANVQEEIRSIALKLGSPDGTIENIPTQTNDTPILQVLAPLFSTGTLKGGVMQIGIDETGTLANIPQGWVFA